LVIEDDKAILQGLQDNLEFEGYKVLCAADGRLGFQIYQEQKPDLILLDLMLPGMNGYEICKRIREQDNETPILMLTARSEEVDQILGLDLGADDYVTKPFSIAGLMARIRALLRRTQFKNSSDLPDQLRLGNVIVDFKSFEATKGGQPLSLSRKEFGILRLLASRAGEVLTRDDLLDEVWGYNQFPTTRTVDNHISQLRSKIEEDPAMPIFIVTVHGVGYKLLPNA
jgi:DNA-binding response OmpR family regulator